MTTITQLSDGRRRRTERSRQAMIDAALSLILGGNFAPTAKQISEEANVGIRSFFRQFEDMEELFAAVDEQTVQAAIGSFSGGIRKGSLEDRLTSLVETYSSAFEENKMLLMTTQSLRWRSDHIKENYAKHQRWSKANIEAWIPEVLELSETDRTLLHAQLSFELWHRLREHQGVSLEEGRTMILRVLSLLLNR
jgi:AcrR family transcriptional regulator